MRKYSLRDRFCPKTGTKLEPKLIWAGEVICDYCGQLHESEDDITPCYTIDETGNIEQSWYRDQLYIGNDEVDIAELYKKHPEFHYCKPWEIGESPAKNCEIEMLQSGKGSTLAEIMQGCRYSVILKKVLEGYTFSDFGLENITKQSIIKLPDGSTFFCPCGGNVFTQHPGNKFECNSCHDFYVGE